MSTQINITEQAINERAISLAHAEARKQLEAEALAAAQAQQDAHRAAQEEYSRRVTTARAGVAALAPNYAQREALERQIGALVDELVTLNANTATAMDAATQDTIAYAIHHMGRTSDEAARDIGGAPNMVHRQTNIKPQTPGDEWAVLLHFALLNGNLFTSGHIEGGRAGTVNVGGYTASYRF